jgi:hypothetical protein
MLFEKEIKEKLRYYGNTIDAVRESLSKMQVVEERTYKYAQIRIFARMTLTMCEILVLVSEGYPNGAFSLSRQVYEGLVIMDYLRGNSCDADLIERFFASCCLSSLRLHRQVKVDGQQSTQIEDQQIREYSKKYSCYCNTSGRLGDYWWAGKDFSFTKLSNQTRFKSNYMYKYTCEITHMSFLNAFFNLGHNENDILIGQSEEGYNTPLWFAMICFADAMNIFSEVIDENWNEVIGKAEKCIQYFSPDAPNMT